MTDHLKHAYDPGTDGIICAATLVDSAADPALTLDIARELLREAAEAIRCLHQYRDALAGVAERESLRQRAAAWDAVADTLGEVCPEWINHPGTGTEAAVAAIRKLAQQPEAQAGGEAVATVAGEFSEVRQDGEVYWLQTVLLKQPQQLPFGAPLYTAPPPSAVPPYEIDALFDALSNLEHDNYERSYSGSKNREADAGLIRAALERYVAYVAAQHQEARND